jgi:hypothetical protein
MAKKLFKVLIELYELVISQRKDDRIGRVVSTGSLKIDDLIEIAKLRRSDISPQLMRAVYDILREVALEEICNSKQVEFGLTYNRLGVSGIFIGDHPSWDSKVNSLSLVSIATAEVREALANSIEVEILGMAQSGTFINTLTDVASGEINARITPGGGVNLSGVRIKIAGEASGVGLHLTEINTETVTDIPSASVLINEPSRITFIVPADLPAGDYRLSLITQFARNVPLKEPRMYVFDYILVCG